jgi:hypothetical protein
MLPKRYVASLVTAVLIGAAAVTFIQPDATSAAGANETPIGAWFGVARPCNPPDGLPPHPVVNQTICNLACNGPCPDSQFRWPNGAPITEVTMIPTLLADGTVLADDFAAILDGHTTAHGKWAFQGKVSIDGNKVDRYQATFIWFQGRETALPPPAFFAGSVRPRFVTFFDKSNPDSMVGFIQPYFYAYTDQNGIVNLQPGTPFPTPDPVAPLPTQCIPPTGPPDFSEPVCLGTLQFTIRRIIAE